MVLSRSLESGSDDSPTSSETDGLDTAITITKPTTDETADESTEIVDGNDATLEKSIVDDWSARFRVWMTELHSGLIVIQRAIDTTHHTLIITEEEDGETSNAVDGNEKATLLEFVDHIGPGNDIHGGDYPECLVFWIDILNDCERMIFCFGFGEAESGMKSGGGGLKIEREERLEPKKVVGMGEGSYIRDSKHLTSLLSHIGVMWRCWGKAETLLEPHV